MKLDGEYIFDGPREEVWAIVRDPDVLVTALPGTQSLEQVSENEYAGKMHIRIGPVSGVFAGKLVVSDEVPPESYTLSVEGRGQIEPPGVSRICSRTSVSTPETAGVAIDVPHMAPYPPLGSVEVMPPSPPAWQPGAQTSGRIRPSSTGPQLENQAIE